MRQQFRLARYLARERVQLIHTHGFYANSFALAPAWLARTPVRIASIRDDGSVWTRAQRAVERVACRLADCTVVNAETIRRRLVAEGWRPESIAVIPNGVDIARFHKPSAPSGLRRELGLPATAPVVGVLARLAPCKGLVFFLDAARIVADRFPDVRFLVVGDQGALADDGVRVGGSYRSGLELRAERLGLKDRVVFAGFRLDVPEILAELAISVLPSITGEGLPNSVLESMAAGLPVVATNSGGTLEAVEDGQTGFLVAPSDAAALAQAIVPLLQDPSLGVRMGAAGRRRIADHFSLDRMTQEMQALYARLLLRRQRATNVQARVTTA
jgi:glycosyltransferase involved in cell wall biosynthesis